LEAYWSSLGVLHAEERILVQGLGRGVRHVSWSYRDRGWFYVGACARAGAGLGFRV